MVQTGISEMLETHIYEELQSRIPSKSADILRAEYHTLRRSLDAS